MLVTEVRKINNRKSRVLLEDGSFFALHHAEVRKLRIHPGEDLSPETIRMILDEILQKRACMRCMNLLKTSDRTVQQLRDCLRRDGYPEEIILRALAYVDSFHYTDDRRYAQNYIRQMSGRKSRRQMEYELLKKGVDRETVRAALSEEGDPEHKTEEEAIRTLARKRGYEPDHATLEEKARFYRYLSGKGFGYESIRSVLESEH